MSEEPVLSICMPIYNRLDSFRYVFSRLIDQMIDLNSNLVEIVVSVNPSDKLEETKTYLFQECRRHNFKININEKNIGGDGNILTAMQKAKGRFVWVVGDDDLILPGVIKNVLDIIEKNKNITWIFLPSARLNGFPNDLSSSVQDINLGEIKPGYYCDGKSLIIEAHKKVDGQLLFSSANIFLREIAIQVAKSSKITAPQLGSTFVSACKGATYIEDKICILAGGEIAWGNISAYNYMIRYHEDLLSAIGKGYTKKEIENLIRYRMRHTQLVLWFTVYREILRNNKDGKKALGYLYKIAPLQTIVTSLFLPVIAVYLLLRHKYHDYIRRKKCIKYIHSEKTDPIVISRIYI